MDLQDVTQTGANSTPAMIKQCQKGERMRNLYIERSELFRDQQVRFLIQLA